MNEPNDDHAGEQATTSTDPQRPPETTRWRSMGSYAVARAVANSTTSNTIEVMPSFEFSI